MAMTTTTNEEDNDETSSATDDIVDDDKEDEDKKSLAPNDDDDDEDDDDRGVGWREALNRYIANINADAERDSHDDDAEAAIMNQISDMNLGDVLSPETLIIFGICTGCTATPPR
ncbi:hypothetical protein MHU86_8758 [Fragilaria crotonensis]|nr:hypothetical protein MHU86_8758 [Fragilaria crotonensis]